MTGEDFKSTIPAEYLTGQKYCNFAPRGKNDYPEEKSPPQPQDSEEPAEPDGLDPDGEFYNEISSLSSLLQKKFN